MSITTGLKVIKLEFILKLKIKHSGWLLAYTCRQAANHCTYILSLRMNLSFINSGPGNATIKIQWYDIPKKRHKTQTVTRQQERNQSKASNFIFLIKMIAKRKRIIRTTLQNENPTHLHAQWEQQQTMNQQQQNHSLRIDSIQGSDFNKRNYF